MAKKKQKWYVVWEGHNPGIYTTWGQAKQEIEGYPAARYKSFTTSKAAQEAFYSDSSQYIGKNIKDTSHISAEEKALIGMPIAKSIAVDAACSGNPGRLEYRGVHTQSGIEIFRIGTFPLGTVNLGEFLALVHGLSYLHKKGDNTTPIYSDSKTALAWVRNKKIKSTLPRHSGTKNLYLLVDRAIAWLHNNTYQNPLLKWETKYWGEIPADFGRK